MTLGALTIALAALACDNAPMPAIVTPVTILVDPAPFASIEAAASAEARVASWADTSRAATACTQCYAAVELRRWLGAAFRLAPADIRLTTTRELPREGDVFVVGNRDDDPLIPRLLSATRRTHRGAREGYHVRSLHTRSRSVVVIAGDHRAGTLYGTYALLEAIGLRFDGLGQTGTVVPRAARLPRTLDLDDAPRFRTRGFWTFEPRGDREFFTWMARNRLNLWTAETPDPALLEKLCVRLTGGGHRVQADALDPGARMPDGRTRFAAHPEWYGLVHGARRGDIHGESGTNFCTSNAAARRELARHLVADLVNGRSRRVDVLEVWPLDGGAWCECDSCRAQGSPTDRWLDVVGAVSAEVRAARARGELTRDVELVAPAYLATLAPPTRAVSPDVDPATCSVTFFPYFRCYEHALSDSTCVELNARLARAYLGWTADPGRHYTGRISVCEYYNVSWVHSLPVVYARVMTVDLPWYAAHGADGVLYMHAPTRLWGSWTLNHAVYARLAWNPEARAESVATGYRRDDFGAAAEPMGVYVASLELATEHITALAHCVGAFGTSAGATGGRLGDVRFPLFPLLHLQRADVDHIARAMSAARQFLDAARAAAAGDTIVVARIAEEERRFAYGEAMFDFWLGLIRVAEAHRAHDIAAARAAWPAVEAAAKRLRNVHDEVHVAGRDADATDGLAASSVVPTYEYFRRLYGGYVPANTPARSP
ncbi:MAG: DUF4838 domain-containing protein [Candidatus Eisenbacteria bacterium]|nr:DUF4838 domain-containing protein [Candidatus Eisenbacteria bacterium]